MPQLQPWRGMARSVAPEEGDLTWSQHARYASATAPLSYQIDGISVGQFPPTCVLINEMKKAPKVDLGECRSSGQGRDGHGFRINRLAASVAEQTDSESVVRFESGRIHQTNQTIRVLLSSAGRECGCAPSRVQTQTLCAVMARPDDMAGKERALLP